MKQVKIFENPQEVKQELIDDEVSKLKCFFCGEFKETEFDVGKDNINACVECIRKRHNLKEGVPDFKVIGKNVKFYSHTTGYETHPLKNIARLFPSIMSNSVFPYSINIIDGYEHYNCLGITKEFGEWLLNNPDFKWRKVKDGEMYDDGDDDFVDMYVWTNPSWDEYLEKEKEQERLEKEQREREEQEKKLKKKGQRGLGL